MGRYKARSDRHPPPYARPKSKEENESHPAQSSRLPVEQGMPKAKHSDLYTFAPFAPAERAASIPPRGPTSSVQPRPPSLASSPVGDPLSTSMPFSAPVAHLNPNPGVRTVTTPMLSPSMSPPALSPPVHSNSHERWFQHTQFWSPLSPPVVLRPPAIRPRALRPLEMPQPALSALPPQSTPQPALRPPAMPSALRPPTFPTPSSFYSPLDPLAASQRPPSTSYSHSAFMTSQQPVHHALSSTIALAPPELSPSALSPSASALDPTPSSWTAPPSLPAPKLSRSMFSRAALSQQPRLSSRPAELSPPATLPSRPATVSSRPPAVSSPSSFSPPVAFSRPHALSRPPVLSSRTTLSPLTPLPSPSPCPQPALSPPAAFSQPLALSPPVTLSHSIALSPPTTHLVSGRYTISPSPIPSPFPSPSILISPPQPAQPAISIPFGSALVGPILPLPLALPATQERVATPSTHIHETEAVWPVGQTVDWEVDGMARTVPVLWASVDRSDEDDARTTITVQDVSNWSRRNVEGPASSTTNLGSWDYGDVSRFWL